MPKTRHTGSNAVTEASEPTALAPQRPRRRTATPRRVSWASVEDFRVVQWVAMGKSAKYMARKGDMTLGQTQYRMGLLRKRYALYTSAYRNGDNEWDADIEKAAMRILRNRLAEKVR